MSATAEQRVLVTGGTGFIGGRLVRRLIARGDRVWCLVRTVSRSGELLAAGAQVVIGDVTDPSSVERAMMESRPMTVFHVAGVLSSQRWGRGSGAFMRVNAGGVEHVAAACAASATPPVLLVVSSLAAAGPCGFDQVRVESDAPQPISNYGRSKLVGEACAAKHAGSVPITIVRPPIVYGPGDRGVLEMFRSIVRTGVHVVPGWNRRGREHRFSMVYVDDLVEGILLAAEKGERLVARSGEQGARGPGVYYITGAAGEQGEEILTYAQIGLAIGGALGRKPPLIVRMPGPLVRVIGFGGDVVSLMLGRAGLVSSDKIAEGLAGSWSCSAAKARAQLGWSSVRALADGLREAAEWYRGAGLL